MKIKVLNPKEKYCEKCGQKNRIYIKHYYDEKTGYQGAELACGNSNCYNGQFYLEWDKENNCSHEFKQDWFLFIPDGKSCRKCGKSLAHE